ncbi:hypothetical protein Cadr_000031062, partial [Camelus dromedarius]
LPGDGQEGASHTKVPGRDVLDREISGSHLLITILQHLGVTRKQQVGNRP